MSTNNKLYLHNIDLNKNQLVNPVLHSLSSPPSNPTDGQLYYNTTEKKVYCYNSTTSTWKQLGGLISGSTNYISKFTAADAIGDSIIYDSGTSVGIGTTSPSSNAKLHVLGNAYFEDTTTRSNLTTGSRIPNFKFNNIVNSTDNSNTGVLPIGPSIEASYKFSGSIGTTVWGNNTIFPQRRVLDLNSSLNLNNSTYVLYGTNNFPNAAVMYAINIGSNDNSTTNTLDITVGSSIEGGMMGSLARMDFFPNQDTGVSLKYYKGLYSAYASYFDFKAAAGSTHDTIIHYAGGTYRHLGGFQIERMYGVYIAPMKGSDPAGYYISNSYAFVQEGANDKNYFAGGAIIGSLSTSGSALVQLNSTTKGFLFPRMTGAQRDAIVKDTATIAIDTPGSGYTDGTYTKRYVTPNTTTNGAGMTVTVTVAGGVVTNVTLILPGTGYAVNDLLTVTREQLGGGSTGAGFKFKVTSLVDIPTGLMVYKTDATEGLYFRLSGSTPTWERFISTYDLSSTDLLLNSSSGNTFIGHSSAPVSPGKLDVNGNIKSISIQTLSGDNLFNTSSGTTYIGYSSTSTEGYKLQVLGTGKVVYIKGSGTGTYLAVFNNDTTPKNYFSIYSDGSILAPTTEVTHRIGNILIKNATITAYEAIVIGSGSTTDQVYFGAKDIFFTVAAGGVYVPTNLNLPQAPNNTTLDGLLLQKDFTNSGAGITSGLNAFFSKIKAQTSTGNVTINHFGVSSVFNTTGGTTLSRGFYYNATSTASAGLSHIAFENVVGNNYFNSSSGSTLIGHPSATASSYKLDVNGLSIFRNTIKLFNDSGYSTNILEININGNALVAGKIDTYGRWYITNGGTNDTALFVGDITEFGQKTSLAMMYPQVNNRNAIGLWNGVKGATYPTYNYSNTSGWCILVDNGNNGSYNELTIGGTMGSGQQASKNLITIDQFSNNGTMVFGTTPGAQTYTLINVPINVNATNTGKILRFIKYNPTITGTAITHYAATFASGQIGVGTETPHASALVELASTTQGFLPPRLTATEANTLAAGSVANGLLIYVTNNGGSVPFTTEGWWGKTSGGWVRLN